MSSPFPDSNQHVPATTSAPATTPNPNMTTADAYTTPTGHITFVLPSAGTYDIPQLPIGPASPRNPTITGSTDGMFSVNADEDRDQLRNELRNRVIFINGREPADNSFWEEILSTRAVSAATVTRIRDLIQGDIDELCELAASQNPLEDEMYAPLTRIFDAIEPGDHSGKSQTRFWKDHHTKYPGTDPEVLMSGLHDKRERQGESSVGGGSDDSIISTERRKTATDAYISTPPAGQLANQNQLDSQVNDNFKRKNISQLKVDRVVDTRKPDWILLDADSSGCMPINPLWRQIAVILELKPNASAAPTEKRPYSSLVVQCSDYVRLHLALRPFQRFSIHFSLCGNLFNAWLIDRAGVIISDTVDIGTDEGADVFIRALVQVTTDLTIYELGMDPTVTVQEGSCLGDKEMPRFSVKMPSGNVYMTKGTPIWQSSSLFGRGTVVWKVEEGDVARNDGQTGPQQISTDSDSTADPQGKPNLHISAMQNKSGAPVADPKVKPDLILKSAYHHPERIAESKFYAAINQANHPGVAIFLEGGDAIHNEEVVTTATHRHDLTPSAQDQVAHRLVLKSKGRRLSEHTSLLELLEAVLASVKGHETLFKYGIIHRDISIGNVFISDDPDVTPGFLGDLDMAKVYDANKLAELIGLEAAQNMIKYTSQGSITGTAQFMALSLLKSNALVHENRKMEGRKKRNSTSTTYARRVSRWIEPTSKNLSPLPSSTSNQVVVENRHITKTATADSQSQNTAPNIIPGPQVDWESAARNDLESFIWVMFYAFCVYEMNTRPLTKGIDGREWHCRTTFVPLFGGVSFQNTLQAHSFASDIMTDDYSEELETWKLNRIPEIRYWDILADLMTYAKAGTLSHAQFQLILEHYIRGERMHDDLES